MADNSTKIVISAEDRATAALRNVRASLGDMNRAAALLAPQLAAVTSALSIGGMAAFIKQSINAADALTDLSARTGLSIETLSGLQWAAHIGDVSMESLAAAVGRLNKAMGEAQFGNKDIAATLERLGVAARDPEQALIQLADAVARMPDPTQRAAELSKLLGKSYQELLPLLNEGGAGIEALMNRGRELNPVTTEMAQRAAEFNDKLDELTASFRTVGYEISNAVLPPLIKLLDEFRDGKEIAGGFLESIRLFGWGIDPFKSTTDSLGRLQDELAKFRAAQKNAGPLGATVDGYLDIFSPQRIAKEIADREKQIEFLTRQRRRELTDQYGWFGDARDNMARGDKPLPSLGNLLGKPEKAGKAKKEVADIDVFGSGGFITKDKATAAAIRESFEFENWAWGQLAGDREKAAAATDALRGKYLEMIDPLQQYRTMLDEIDRLEALGREAGGLDAVQALEARWRVNEAMDAQIDKADKLNDKLEEQTEIGRELGLTFSSAFEDAIVGGKKFSDVIGGLGQDIARLMVRKSVTEPMAGAFSTALKDFNWGKLWPFADGGVMTGAGPMPLRAYAGGGIANSPQLAMFGEGSMPEAFVPLPDGRRIPVAMQGGGQGITINTTIDARGADPSVLPRLQQAMGEMEARIYRNVPNINRAQMIRARRTPY